MTLFEQDVIRRLKALEDRQDRLDKLIGASTGLFRAQPAPPRLCGRCGQQSSPVRTSTCTFRDCPASLGVTTAQLGGS